jgi:hypothetical protein
LQSCWWKEIQSLDAEVDEESKLFCPDVCVDCVEFEDNFLKVLKKMLTCRLQMMIFAIQRNDRFLYA